MRFISLPSVTLFALLLTACGGSLEGEVTESTEDTVVATDEEVQVGDITDNDTATIAEEIVVESAAPAEPGVPSSLAYIGASQSWIAIKGTGGADRRESSVVTFQLLDRNGDPIIEGKNVTFDVDAPSGTFLDPLVGTTDDQGYVSVTVNSGKVPGPVTVHVELDDTPIKTLSGIMSVTTGLPDQDSISISLTDFAPEAWDENVVKVGVTVQLADHWNTTVPDGTVVYFHTEGGQIQNQDEPTGFCLTELGKCTVDWISGNPRPTDGRVTITAYADGEESFTDKDGDGWFTEGDIYTISTSPKFNKQTDLGEVFYDYNNNHLYDESSAEEFKDKDTDANPLDGAYNGPDGLFTGVLCSDGQEALGNCVKSLVQVMSNTTLVMATTKLQCKIYADGADVTNGTIDLTTATGEKSYTLDLVMTDLNGNTPPTKTAVALTTENGVLSGKTSWDVEPADDLGAYTQQVTIKRESEPNEETSGELLLAMTTPDQQITSDCRVTVIDDAAPEEEVAPVVVP